MHNNEKEKISHNNLKKSNLFEWIFSVLFLIVGIGNLFTTPIASFFMLLIGLFILPPIKKIIEEKIGYEFGFWKSFGIILVLIFLSGFISGLTGIGNDESKLQNNNTSIETKNVQTNQIAKTTYVPKVKEIPKETTYSLNQNIKVDYLNYKITKVEEFTSMGTSFMEKTTTGKFIKVYLEITNLAKNTKQIFTPRFKIQDNEGRNFDRLSDDMFYISDPIQFGVQLQPGLMVKGAVVFEMPVNSQDLELVINGDWSSISEIKIKLDNIQNIGSDTTLQDKQNAQMNKLTEDAKKQTEKLMNQCNAPFKCSSNCDDYMDVGQKDCQSGQICCMN